MAAWPHSSGLEGTRVRYSAGMIWSVSMFCTHSKASAVVASRQSGAAAGGRRRGGGGGGGARAAGQRGAVKAARAGASGRPSPPDVCTPPTTEQQRRQTHILGDEALAADFARAALQVDLGLHHQARGPAPRPPAAGGPCKLHAGAAARAAGLHSGVGASLPVGCAAWRAGAATDGAGGGAAGAEAGRLQCASLPAQPACTAGPHACWGTRAQHMAPGEGPARPLFWLLVAPQVRRGPGGGAGAWPGMVAPCRRRAARLGPRGAANSSASRQERAAAPGGGRRAASGRRQSMHPAWGGRAAPIGPPGTRTRRWQSAARQAAHGRPGGASRRPLPPAPRRLDCSLAALLQGKEQRCRAARATARARAICSAAASGAAAEHRGQHAPPRLAAAAVPHDGWDCLYLHAAAQLQSMLQWCLHVSASCAAVALHGPLTAATGPTLWCFAARRQKGFIPLSTYLTTYKLGDYVDIKVNAAVHKVRMCCAAACRQLERSTGRQGRRPPERWPERRHAARRQQWPEQQGGAAGQGDAAWSAWRCDIKAGWTQAAQAHPMCQRDQATVGPACAVPSSRLCTPLASDLPRTRALAAGHAPQVLPRQDRPRVERDQARRGRGAAQAGRWLGGSMDDCGPVGSIACH